MITPNLAVTDMVRSLAFYRDVLGMSLHMAVSADRQLLNETDGSDAVFAVLTLDGVELMLQLASSLAEELPVFDGSAPGKPNGTIYFRNLHPNKVMDRLPKDAVVKGPFQQWYGMYEVYLRDPDGHVLCLGAPEGAAPQS